MDNQIIDLCDDSDSDQEVLENSNNSTCRYNATASSSICSYHNNNEYSASQQTLTSQSVSSSRWSTSASSSSNLKSPNADNSLLSTATSREQCKNDMIDLPKHSDSESDSFYFDNDCNDNKRNTDFCNSPAFTKMLNHDENNNDDCDDYNSTMRKRHDTDKDDRILLFNDTSYTSHGKHSNSSSPTSLNNVSIIDLADDKTTTSTTQYSSATTTSKNCDENVTKDNKEKNYNNFETLLSSSSDDDDDDEINKLLYMSSYSTATRRNHSQQLIDKNKTYTKQCANNEMEVNQNFASIKNQNMISLLSDDDNDDDNDNACIYNYGIMNDTKDGNNKCLEFQTPSQTNHKKSVSFSKNSYILDSDDSDDDDDDLLSPGPFARKKKRSIPLSCEKFNAAISTKKGLTTTCSSLKSRSSSSSSSSSNFKAGTKPVLSVSTSMDNGNDFNFGVTDLISPPPIPSHQTSSISNSFANTTGTATTISHETSSTNALTPSSRNKKVPTPSLPQIDTSKIGGKLYPDYRHEFIQELDLHARKMRLITHQRRALDSCIRAIVSLSLYRYPVRSAYAVCSINGVGDTLLSDVLQEAEKNCKGKPYFPPSGKFSSVTCAVLVCLLEYENEQQNLVSENSKENFCSMEELLRRVNEKVHYRKANTRAFPKDINYYLDKNNIDPGWMQVLKLCSDNVRADRSQLIKQKSRKNECQSGIVFQLLEEGRNEAIRLVASLNQGPLPAGPLRQLASDTVDEVYGNVTISMDFREGGGGSKKLHDMCSYFDDNKIPYVVRNLKISDYVFFVGDKLAPILIERKSIEDVAHSLHDGRWKRQQHSMRKAQFVLGGGEARRCQLCYLIEGDASMRTVHGGFIGRRAWGITTQDTDNAIAELPMLGFSVMTTKTKMGSLHKIAQIARDVLWKERNGSIDCNYTYDTFISAVNRLDDSKGNPPTDIQHQNPAPPIAESLTPLGRHSRNLMNATTMGNDDSGDDEELDETQKAKEEELNKHSLSELKELLKERDEKSTGTKKELVARLLQKRKPEILITRARRKQYVPKVPSCNAAILVAILINDETGTTPLKKETIMNIAEETGVSKDPMFGNGKSWYDGWSGIKDLTGGDPPLVSVVKRKYALTTQPYGAAGVDVAKAIHVIAHRMKLCRCGRYIS